MSEEQEEQVEQEVEEVATEEVAEQEQPAQEQGNSLFNALFEAAEEPEPEEPEEDLGEPITLNAAIDELDREPVAEEEESEEEVEPEGEVEEEIAEEPGKDQPKPKAAKKKKVKQVVDPDIDQPEVAPQYAFPEEDPDKEFVDGLLPEEKDIYDLAKFASDNLDGYVGKDKEFKDYFQKTKKYIEKRIQDDPHVDLSEDEDYQAFIQKNRPDFDQFTIKKVERERNVHEAMRRIEEKQAPEKERARMEQEKARKAPVVQGHKAEFREYSVNAIPKELADHVKDEESIKNFAETNPLEFQIVNTLTTELHHTGDLLLDITQGMVSYDENNPIHAKLLQWVNTEQENFIQSGQTQQDGKTFMRRERYFRLPENKRAPYYTWNDADLLAILTMRANQRINESLNQQRQLLEKSGYARQVQQKPKAQKPQVKKRAVPPKVASKPRPGNSPAETPSQPKKSAFESVLGM
jgi:hypothetical protein